MREIKFRAWDSSESKMIYLDDQSMSVEINFLNNWTYNHKTYWEVVAKEGEPGYPHMSQYVDSRNDENVLMQYTNLKDKNDKEIYESDVVADQYGYRFEIVFRDGCWFAGNSEVGFSPKDTWNVIGNIYEDSHLLDNSKDK